MKNKIDSYIRQKAGFIDQVRDVFARTNSEQQKKARNEVFDTLLLTATCSSLDELEQAMTQMLPREKSDITINYMIEQLREINGFCTCSFSDKHEVYRDLFHSLTFPTPESRQNVREMLRDSMITMIVNKTGTSATNTVGIS